MAANEKGHFKGPWIPRKAGVTCKSRVLLKDIFASV